MAARWGIYDQGAVWDPVPIEAAYQHQFDLFTHESRLGDSATWRGPGITKPPGLALVRGAICSIGINAYVIGGDGLKHPVPSTSGLWNAGFDSVAHGEYDAQVTAWINVLLAYKAEGGQVHALFHLEPSLNNPGQPTAGTSSEYKAAFAHIYPAFNAAGIELGWDSTSSDWRTGIALSWEPAVYDICSADFYPTADVTKTFTWGLGAFFAHAASAHPANPVLVRSTTCKSFTDAQAATWFADASDVLLAVPNLLGVGWDTDNQGLHLLNPGETYPNYSGATATKLAFYNAAQDWGAPVIHGDGWGTGGWGSMPWGGGAAGGTKFVIAPHLAVAATMFPSKVRAGVTMNLLSVPVTLRGPSVATTGTQTVPAPHLTVPVTLFGPRMLHASNIVAAPHLNVPLTFYGPSIKSGLLALHLAVPVTFYGAVIAQQALARSVAEVRDYPLAACDVRDTPLHDASVVDRALHYAGVE